MSEEGFTEETSEPCAEGSGVTIDDFVAYMPQHVYIFMPCREPWPAASINARLGKVPVVVGGKRVMLSASTWLDQNRPVECMTWARLIRCTVPGSTPNCLAMTRTPGRQERPGPTPTRCATCALPLRAAITQRTRIASEFDRSIFWIS